MFKKFLDPDGTPFELDIQSTDAAGFVCSVIPDAQDTAREIQFAGFRLLGPDLFEYRTAAGERKTGAYHVAGDTYFLQIDGQSYRLRRAKATQSGKAGSGAHHTPMPGKVLAVHVSTGDSVEQDQPLLVVEAMKMENAIRAAISGKVVAVGCQVGDIVGPEDVLVEVAAEG